MIIVQICVGSSCHLKGSETIVEMFRKVIEERHLEDQIVLAGSFCTGQCNRQGVTITVDGTVYTGVTPESFTTFFEKNVMPLLG